MYPNSIHLSLKVVSILVLWGQSIYYLGTWILWECLGCTSGLRRRLYDLGLQVYLHSLSSLLRVENLPPSETDRMVENTAREGVLSLKGLYPKGPTDPIIRYSVLG